VGGLQAKGCKQERLYPRFEKCGGEGEGISGSGMRINIYCGGGIKVPCVLFVHFACAVQLALEMLPSLFPHGRYVPIGRVPNVALAPLRRLQINHHLQPFARE